MQEQSVEHSEWESSPWPLVLSVGILFMAPFSFSLYFVYQQPLLAFISLGIGVPLMVLSIIGWTMGCLQDKVHHGGEPGYGIKAMPFFILAEAFIFVAFFAAYWVLRLLAPSWPPEGTIEFEVMTPIIMTIILVTSSVTIHVAESKLERDDMGAFTLWLVVTIILGLVFFLISASEWKHLMHSGFNVKTNIFSTFFYSITGFHASHVLVGLVMFICILIPALSRNVSKTFMKSASLYWHFVDLIWFFVVTQIYFW
ncbi:MAG: heme-copper oxidase subunit III [Thermodesulfobacteriota bacterium]